VEPLATGLYEPIILWVNKGRLSIFYKKSTLQKSIDFHCRLLELCIWLFEKIDNTKEFLLKNLVDVINIAKSEMRYEFYLGFLSLNG